MAELFAKFEVNKTPWWPRIAHLVGGSCALHLVMAACVLYIPALRSAFNIMEAFGGGGLNIVDEDYQKTLIGERAQIIEFPHERFQYPEGYFSNGEQPVQLDPNGAPVIVQQYTPPPPPPAPMRMPRYRAPRAVTPRPLPAESPSPGPAGADKATATASNGGKPEEKKTEENKPAPVTEEDKKMEQIAAQNGIKRPKTINKKPFTDWLKNANNLRNSNQIDLSGTVEIVVEADGIDENGRLIEPEVTPKAGDPRLQALAKDLVSALSDSGVLDFLGGIEHISLTFKMDDANVEASVVTEVKSEQEASKKALGYGMILILAAEKAKKGNEEAATLYSNTKVRPDGKQIILSFSLPRQAAGDMLKKQIEKPPTS